ncbi:MAG: hypothetical protein HDR72_01920, partial [Ruminococcaceae bacterium]|nr:hypothetical protein [Oscillospiraceae bacterium]
GITTIQSISATQLLFIIEYAAFNSQSAIGDGITKDITSEYHRTGEASSLGNASGAVVTGAVSYRGEENLWGNIYNFVDGINIYNGKVYIADHDFSDNKISDPYVLAGCLPSINGYISSFNNIDGLFIPSANNGNSALPIGDYCWRGSSEFRLPVMNGTNIKSDLKDATGLFVGAFNQSITMHNLNVGARLIFIPQSEITAQEVTAND